MLAEGKLLVGFDAVLDGKTTMLILGSMPSEASLRAGEYYAHPRNRFWPLMALLLTGEEKAPEDYRTRLKMIVSRHIGLWDAIASCRREGSLDSAICDETGNDFAALIEKYPQVTKIICNGAKSYACFKRFNKPLLTHGGLTVVAAPSTSPANARYRMSELAKKWSEALTL